MNRPYVVTLSTLELEYLLALLDCEASLDPESQHLPQEAELRADTITRVKSYVVRPGDGTARNDQGE